MGSVFAADPSPAPPGTERQAGNHDGADCPKDGTKGSPDESPAAATDA